MKTNEHQNRTSPSIQTLPCVVQLGFAGSRQLVDDSTAEPEVLATIHAAVERFLTERLSRLPAELRLDANHFLVGISQVACGADTIFTRACQALALPQRILLPESREAYLSATSADGVLDFTPDQRAEATSLLAAEHVIQERVVSHSPDRTIRFQQTNIEILRISDVVVCMLRENAPNKPGGTNQFLGRAIAKGAPVLEIRVGLKDGQPAFQERWHNMDAQHPFQAPRLPDELARLPMATEFMPPSRDEYCRPLKNLVSSQADWHQKIFKFAAVLIIATHTLATICATLAVAFHGVGESHDRHPPQIVGQDHEEQIEEEAATWPYVTLLAVEVGLLTIGLVVHRHLHHSRAARVWAVSRVVAELARSLEAIGNRHVYLEYFFRLALPYHFRFLLRTLNVLHLRSTWKHRNDDWKPIRTKYIEQRFEDPKNGQICFYETRLEQDERRMNRCQWAFAICSALAIAATMIKLSLLLHHEWLADWNEFGMATLGSFAIVLPVLAVGGLSWAAALDCEARVETFSETLSFLRRQKLHLEQADTADEFEFLLMETETALLGEIANWFSRRSTTGVN